MKIPQTKRYSIYKKFVFQEELRRINEDDKDKRLIFEPDGRKHYVYRVTDLYRDMEEHYYGSRTTEKDNLIEDFWSYRTSSNYNTIDKHRKEDYKVKIIKSFDNSGDKVIYESFLHQYFDVRNNSSFWNKANQTPFGFNPCTFWTDEHKQLHSEAMKGERNPMFENGHSEETKKKLKEMWNTKEGKQKCSDRAKLGWNDERKKEQSLRTSGDNDPSKRKEVKEKMSKAWTKERKEAFACQYCGMKNNKTNHFRWHDEKCKHKVIK